MRISDWSSDVFSSDLALAAPPILVAPAAAAPSAAASPARAKPGAMASRSAAPASAGSIMLDMQAAVDKAVRWHPLLRNARGQLLQVGEGVDAARAGYYPSVTAGVNKIGRASRRERGCQKV